MREFSSSILLQNALMFISLGGSFFSNQELAIARALDSGKQL